MQMEEKPQRSSSLAEECAEPYGSDGDNYGGGGKSTLNLAIWTPTSVIAGQIYREGDV